MCFPNPLKLRKHRREARKQAASVSPTSVKPYQPTPPPSYKDHKDTEYIDEKLAQNPFDHDDDYSSILSWTPKKEFPYHHEMPNSAASLFARAAEIASAENITPAHVAQLMKAGLYAYDTAVRTARIASMDSPPPDAGTPRTKSTYAIALRPDITVPGYPRAAYLEALLASRQSVNHSLCSWLDGAKITMEHESKEERAEVLKSAKEEAKLARKQAKKAKKCQKAVEA